MGATWSNKYGNARVNKAEPLGVFGVSLFMTDYRKRI